MVLQTDKSHAFVLFTLGKNVKINACSSCRVEAVTDDCARARARGFYAFRFCFFFALRKSKTEAILVIAREMPENFEIYNEIKI